MDLVLEIKGQVVSHIEYQDGEPDNTAYVALSWANIMQFFSRGDYVIYKTFKPKNYGTNNENGGSGSDA